MKKLILSVFSACFATLAFSAGIDGKWEGHIPDYPEFVVTYTFNVDGETVTGKVSSEMGELEILNGKVSGGEFSFELDFEGTNVSHNCNFKDDDTIILTFEGWEGRMEMTLKRIKEE